VRLVEGPLKAGEIVGLQQIIEGGGIESPHRVLVVGGGEDHLGHGVGVEASTTSKP